jgi:hypothetical protein
MQRYFNGIEWTEHYAAAASPPAVPVAGVIKVGSENHVAHLALTLFTCGLWLPIWLIIAVFEQRRPVAVDIYGNIIQPPRPPGEPPPGPPAWLDKFPWLHKLPGDPMLWVITAGVFGFIALLLIIAAVGALVGAV